MREDYQSCRRIAFSDIIRWVPRRLKKKSDALPLNSKDIVSLFQQLILRSLTLVHLESHSPLVHLSAYDGLLEYVFGWKAVLGMKGALTAIRMALTARGWIRELPGWGL